MRTPCAEDLRDAAEYLRGDELLVMDQTALKRVAIWLDAVASERDDRSRRARARAMGVSTRYLRTVIEAGN